MSKASILELGTERWAGIPGVQEEWTGIPGREQRRVSSGNPVWPPAGERKAGQEWGDFTGSLTGSLSASGRSHAANGG